MSLAIRLQGDLFVSNQSRQGEPVVYSPSNLAMLFDDEPAAQAFIAGMAQSGHPLPAGYQLATAYCLVGHPQEMEVYLSTGSAPNRPPHWRDRSRALTFQNEQNARTFVDQLLFRNDEEREVLSSCRYVLEFAPATEQ